MNPQRFWGTAKRVADRMLWELVVNTFRLLIVAAVIFCALIGWACAKAVLRFIEWGLWG